MTSTKKISEVFNSAEKVEVNENLCFNTKLLEECKKSPHISKILKKPDGSLYGEALDLHPMLIDIRQIHDLSYISHKTDSSKDLPNGFQTRAVEDLDVDVVDELSMAMSLKKWDSSLMCGVVFELPDEYKGQSFSPDGTERLYGIGNLHHRYYAALKSCQTHIIAWRVKFKSLRDMYKWAIAEANRKQYASNPRDDMKDISYNIIKDTEDKDSPLSIALSKVSTPEEQEKIIKEEVETYNVSHKTRDAIIRRLGHKGAYTPNRKKWDAAFMKEFVQENFSEWVESGNDIYDYISENDIPVVLAQDEGRGSQEVANKWAEHVLGENGQLKVLFSLKKYGIIDKSTADEVRRMFMQKVGDHIKKMGKAYQIIYVDGTGTLPMYEALPEFAGEKNCIKLY